MKRRLRLTIRTLLILSLVSALPCCWVASEIAQHRTEHEALAHMRVVNPRTCFVWTNQTPAWLQRFGVAPEWMNRISTVDATGVTCGRLEAKDRPQSKIDFDDENLREIADDLKNLKHLTEIWFQVTKISDKSVDLFGEFPNVELICLHETNVTESGAREMQERMPATYIYHPSLYIPVRMYGVVTKGPPKRNSRYELRNPDFSTYDVDKSLKGAGQ